MVQWLRLHPPNAGGSIPGRETRSHMLQLRLCMPQLKIPDATVQTEDSRCCNEDPTQPKHFVKNVPISGLAKFKPVLLKGMSLNCVGSLICGYFSLKHTPQYHDQQWLISWMRNHDCGRSTMGLEHPRFWNPQSILDPNPGDSVGLWNFTFSSFKDYPCCLFPSLECSSRISMRTKNFVLLLQYSISSAGIQYVLHKYKTF